MKITKTREDANMQEYAKKVANIRCHTCPECGEAKDFWEYCKKNIVNRGIMSMGHRTEYKGIFFAKTYHIDCYKCLTCRAEWESEPYLVD